VVAWGLDLQILFELHVHRIWANIPGALLVSQDRRHLFVTPWVVVLTLFPAANYQKTPVAMALYCPNGMGSSPKSLFHKMSKFN
jgi:hypothetical protein